MSNILEREINRITEGDYLLDRDKIVQLTEDVAVKFGEWRHENVCYIDFVYSSTNIDHNWNFDSIKDVFTFWINNIYKP